MPNVIFKRPWRTPFGRFAKSESGVPTPVPQSVLNIHKLPSDAKIVSDDYVLPSDRDEEPNELNRAALDQVADIHKKVDEQLAPKEAKRRAEKNERVAKKAEELATKATPEEEGLDEAEDADEELNEAEDADEELDVEAYLSLSVRALDKAIGEANPPFSDGELNELLKAEQDGTNRVGAVAAIKSYLGE